MLLEILLSAIVAAIATFISGKFIIPPIIKGMESFKLETNIKFITCVSHHQSNEYWKSYTKEYCRINLIAFWSGIKSYKKFIQLKRNRVFHLCWGIVIVGLAVLHRENIGFSNLEAVGSYAAIIVGIILEFYTTPIIIFDMNTFRLVYSIILSF